MFLFNSLCGLGGILFFSVRVDFVVWFGLFMLFFLLVIMMGLGDLIYLIRMDFYIVKFIRKCYFFLLDIDVSFDLL